MSSSGIDSFLQNKVKTIVERQIQAVFIGHRAKEAKQVLKLSPPAIIKTDMESLRSLLEPELEAITEALKPRIGREKTKKVIDDIAREYGNAIHMVAKPFRTSHGYSAAAEQIALDYRAPTPEVNFTVLGTLEPNSIIIYKKGTGIVTANSYNRKIRAILNVALRILDSRFVEILDLALKGYNEDRTRPIKSENIVAKVSKDLGRQPKANKKDFIDKIVASLLQQGISGRTEAAKLKNAKSIANKAWRAFAERTSNLVFTRVRTNVSDLTASVGTSVVSRRNITKYAGQDLTPLGERGSGSITSMDMRAIERAVYDALMEAQEDFGEKRVRYRNKAARDFTKTLLGGMAVAETELAKKAMGTNEVLNKLILRRVHDLASRFGKELIIQTSLDESSSYDAINISKIFKGKISIGITESGAARLSVEEINLLRDTARRIEEQVSTWLFNNAPKLSIGKNFDEMAGAFLDKKFYKNGNLRFPNYKSKSSGALKHKTVVPGPGQKAIMIPLPVSPGKRVGRSNAVLDDYVAEEARGGPNQVQLGEPSVQTSLEVVKAVLQRDLVEQVKRNMVRPKLQLRTGRFAESVRLVEATQGVSGLVSLKYTYMLYPYQTFEPGWRQGSVQRDPRKIISQSIRELVAPLVRDKFRSIRVE